MTWLIFQANPWLFPTLMLIVLALAIEVPYRLGRPFSTRVSKQLDAFTVLQAGLFTLASFVLGLSFAQASARFDIRRDLVVKEANAIGTTWLRANQLPPPQANGFRRILTDYTAARLKAYGTPRDEQLYTVTIVRSSRDQDAMWHMASTALRSHPSDLGLSLLVQTLNDTIDVSAEQLQALTVHVPTIVVLLTLALVALGAVSLGLRFARDQTRPPILSAIYVVAYMFVISMMIDYDRPQTGFVRVPLYPLTQQLSVMKP
ncbi:MAG: hypothetical protein JOY69_11300 [Candidatus Eremiobacteraeota bacterium]|nr:hypothetical protein [Candidatus Eremiobacteraeota bacterium]